MALDIAARIAAKPRLAVEIAQAHACRCRAARRSNGR